MNHPIIVSANGNERLNRMIKEAENYRRVKAITASKPKKWNLGKIREQFVSQVPKSVGKSADSPA
jgi:hypothetical protein